MERTEVLEEEEQAHERELEREKARAKNRPEVPATGLLGLSLMAERQAAEEAAAQAARDALRSEPGHVAWSAPALSAYFAILTCALVAFSVGVMTRSASPAETTLLDNASDALSLTATWSAATNGSATTAIYTTLLNLWMPTGAGLDTARFLSVIAVALAAVAVTHIALITMPRAGITGGLLSGALFITMPAVHNTAGTVTPTALGLLGLTTCTVLTLWRADGATWTTAPLFLTTLTTLACCPLTTAPLIILTAWLLITTRHTPHPLRTIWPTALGVVVAAPFAVMALDQSEAGARDVAVGFVGALFGRELFGVPGFPMGLYGSLALASIVTLWLATAWSALFGMRDRHTALLGVWLVVSLVTAALGIAFGAEGALLLAAPAVCVLAAQAGCKWWERRATVFLVAMHVALMAPILFGQRAPMEAPRVFETIVETTYPAGAIPDVVSGVSRK